MQVSREPKSRPTGKTPSQRAVLAGLADVLIPAGDGMPSVSANPVYFVVALRLWAVGARKRWLNGYEILLSLGLLVIPYGEHAYPAFIVF